MHSPHEEALFTIALAKPASERAAFLDRECGDDKTLRQRLESLLAAHAAKDSFLEPDAPQPNREPLKTIKLEMPDDEPPDEAVGQTLGRYKLLERVGEGGCGVVYVAEQTEPVRRRVALKVIKLGMDTKQVVARFEAERQALAMMDHPNIAKVLDAGTTDVGRPYFVMELVRGIKITDYCDQANLTTKERLDLFIKVCQAIQHAHQKGIIHRDIKPSNILVTLHDGVPVPKVIDFGIAKATEGRLTDATVYTQLHQFIGTPAYMSPEQAEMSGLDIDTRSDIYSLGVLLYELLAGSTPFDPKELMASGIDAMRKTIREKEPVRPSTKLSQTLVAANVSSLISSTAERPTTEEEVRADSRRLLRLRETITLLKGDLDWIVMKCLEKDRTRRYETANGLAADITRHLTNEPVVARPPSTGYRLQKAFRRNKLAFAAGTAITAALVLGVIGTTIGLVRAERQRQAAEAAQRLVEKRFQSARQFVEEVFDTVAPEFSGLVGATKAREALARTSVTFLESLASGSEKDESFQAELAKLYGQLALSLGNPYAPNSIGDYEGALRFANQSLQILQAIQSKQPNRPEALLALARAHDRVGSILLALARPQDAMVHHRQNRDLLRQFLERRPDSSAAKEGLQIANFRIGHDLRAQGRTREALEEYYLPNAGDLLGLQVSPETGSDRLHMSLVLHALVGGSRMELGEPAVALPHLEQALGLTRMLVDREPNNARYARDWVGAHRTVGAALVALGRFEEGRKQLEEGVQLAENLATRDPMNGAAQAQLIQCLHEWAKGSAKAASAAKTTPARQAELWREVVQILTRCEQRLAAPELERIKPQFRNTAQEVNQELREARSALANASGAAESSSTP